MQISGDFDHLALAAELEAAIGPTQADGNTRWSYTVSGTRDGKPLLTLELLDAGIDAAAAQAILDAHIAEESVAGRKRRRLIEKMTPWQCPECGGHQWRFGAPRDRSRAVQFLVFAAVLVLAGLGMRAGDVPGSWVAYGCAALVLSQAAFKWFMYAARNCDQCSTTIVDWFGRPALPPRWEALQAKLLSAESSRREGKLAAYRTALQEVQAGGHVVQRNVAQQLLGSLP